MYDVHIALQELQAAVVMLHRMAFHLSGMTVALHLDNSTAKDCLWNWNGTLSPSFGTTLWHIESGIQACVTHISAYKLTYLNVKSNYM